MKYFKTSFAFRTESGERVDDGLRAIAQELCAAIAGTVGYESFEDSVEGIDGYIQQQDYDEEGLKATMEEFPVEGVRVDFTTTEAEDKNWNEEWEKNGFEPITIEDRLIIHDAKHMPEKDYPLDIVIDAKLAFGTGTHDTTRMIVTELMHTELKGKTVLDCGCGTGILSIAASRLGAERAVGYDIDEWSVENTIYNAEMNGVENVSALKGDASVIDSLKDCRFDLVVANINRNILLADMPKMVEALATGGLLILSGFYSEDVEVLTEKARELNLEPEGKRMSDNWTMLRFRKV